MRCLKGETSKLGTLARKISAAKESTPVILTGPYGSPLLRDAQSLLLIAGGTGVSLTLPLAFEATRKQSAGLVQFVWIIRHVENMDWIAAELENLKLLARSSSNLHIQIYITREAGSHSNAPSTNGDFSKDETDITQTSKEGDVDIIGSSEAQNGFTVTHLGDHHPSMQAIVDAYMDRAPSAGGRVQIMASGLSGMGQELRTAVAGWNNGSEVWRGGEGEKYDVELHWDNRSG